MTALVKKLKEKNQDFEWYPTTAEIIECIRKDIKKKYPHHNPSILDCGAGDGRVLEKLTKGYKYALEKSQKLISLMHKEIFVIGTDFNNQTLIDKKTDIIFSNPPYSDFSNWSQKIIKEANSAFIYLVIPERWERDENIKRAIETRKAEYKVIGKFDFLNAERKARAKVHVIRIDLAYGYYAGKFSSKRDPFYNWVKENGFRVNPSKRSSHLNKHKIEIEKKSLVLSGDTITILDSLYQKDLHDLIESYRKLTAIDPMLLDELGIDSNSVTEGLRLKIEGLKNVYWQELFNTFNRITDRLTKASREQMLKTLTGNTSIDFNTENCHAVIVWVIKNANDYIDSQLIDVYHSMSKDANIIKYKSNQRTFLKDEWWYNGHPEERTHYKLDYRVVLNKGGINQSNYSRDHVNNLDSYAADFLNDLCSISRNLGFFPESKASDFQWEPGKKVNFMHKDGVLFEVKAFKNGNMHIKFNSLFMIKINVEVGRLLGWVKNKKQAAEEMDIDLKDVQTSFKSNNKLTKSNLLALREL